MSEMTLVYTGPRRVAFILHRNMKADGHDAVLMTGTDEPLGSVFVPEADIESRTAIDRAIERAQIEYDNEGGTA